MIIVSASQRAFNRLSAFQRSLISAIAALLGYGGWAYLVNSMHGESAAFKAACVQGGYSFTLTFVVTMLIEGLYRSLNRVLLNGRTAQAVTVIATCAILFSTSWWINAMAGTPEIFSTVILGYVIGAIYTTSYVAGLAYKKRQPRVVQP